MGSPVQWQQVFEGTISPVPVTSTDLLEPFKGKPGENQSFDKVYCILYYEEVNLWVYEI